MLRFYIEIDAWHLKVLSSISSNLAAGFIILAIGASNELVLISNLTLTVICVIISIKTEKTLENLR